MQSIRKFRTLKQWVALGWPVDHRVRVLLLQIHLCLLWFISSFNLTRFLVLQSTLISCLWLDQFFYGDNLKFNWTKSIASFHQLSATDANLCIHQCMSEFLTRETIFHRSFVANASSTAFHQDITLSSLVRWLKNYIVNVHSKFLLRDENSWC